MGWGFRSPPNSQSFSPSAFPKKGLWCLTRLVCSASPPESTELKHSQNTTPLVKCNQTKGNSLQRQRGAPSLSFLHPCFKSFPLPPAAKGPIAYSPSLASNIRHYPFTQSTALNQPNLKPFPAGLHETLCDSSTLEAHSPANKSHQIGSFGQGLTSTYN